MSHMKPKVCRECGWKFHEDSLQVFRRLNSNEGPICKDCYRIQYAEERAKKRHIKANMSPEEKIFDILRIGERKYGLTSVAYIQRKFGLTYENAVMLFDKFNELKKVAEA